MAEILERRPDARETSTARAFPRPVPQASEQLSATGLQRFASRSRRQFALIVVLETGALLVGLAGFSWWTHGRFVQTTNDAYLRADAVSAASRTQGYVQAVLVRDNQPVVTGQPLVRIDPASYEASLAARQATAEARAADLLAARRQIQQQHAVVDRAQVELAGANATNTFTKGEAERVARLAAQGVETAAHAAQARHAAEEAASAARADADALRQAQGQVGILQAQAGAVGAQLQAAQAEARAVAITLEETTIRAGISGVVGDRAVRVGQYVQPGTRLLSLVPVQDIYVVANFKETQVERIRVGQAASVRIDALSGRRLDATVDSFAPGTGTQFALLPAENATGNFIKIVQRIPVRLRLEVPPELRGHLVPGLSATVRIDTRVRRPSGP